MYSRETGQGKMWVNVFQIMTVPTFICDIFPSTTPIDIMHQQCVNTGDTASAVCDNHVLRVGVLFSESGLSGS